LAAALDYIRATPAIWEVILTGGDPLILSPRRLSEIVSTLNVIPHVAVIRVHSRIPIAAPERVTDDLIAALSATSKPVYLSVHCNHADELTVNVKAALARLRSKGVTLLSQSVLLRGVNDSPTALEALFRSLAANGVKPYYLHHLDHAPGTSRFRIPLAEGRALFKSLRGRVSGLALPTYVIDIPGGAGKVPVSASFVSTSTDGEVVVEDPRGTSHNLGNSY
ncbi:MAG: lysine 2,3-aminomutase, partial [Rhodobacteraceae bacterium]|nr:lysine 2,3-aminomutase [Paracoccaceae bacterium]